MSLVILPRFYVAVRMPRRILIIKRKFRINPPNAVVKSSAPYAQIFAEITTVFDGATASILGAVKNSSLNWTREMAASRQDDFRVALCGDLSLPAIADAHQKVLSAFDQDLPIVIDLDGVTNADLTLVQLLEAARKSAENRGRALSLSAPASGATRAVLERGGFLSTADRAAFWLQQTVAP